MLLEPKAAVLAADTGVGTDRDLASDMAGDSVGICVSISWLESGAVFKTFTGVTTPWEKLPRMLTGK